jgi:hypothetical protein
VLMKGAISLGSIFNGYDAASSADGIPLATFTPTAAETVVTLFALLGLSQLMPPLLSPDVAFMNLPNVGFSCERGWRGLCASTRRDRRDCRVQAFVRPQAGPKQQHEPATPSPEHCHGSIATELGQRSS